MTSPTVTFTSTPQAQAQVQGDCVGSTPIDRAATDSFHALCVRPTVLADGTTFMNRLGKPANVLATSSYSICESGELREAPMSIVVNWYNATTVAKLANALDSYSGKVTDQLRAHLMQAMPIHLHIQARQTFQEMSDELAALRAQVAANPQTITTDAK